MSLFGAMNTAISGLTAQSAAFGNIGDNVANSQTVGFKRTDTSFQDFLTVSNASDNQSGSVVARPDYVNTVQGTVLQTDKPLDLAITGQGFFTVSRPVGELKGAPVFRPEAEYTRAGDFSLNRDGFLVNSSGHFLNGWTQDLTKPAGTLDQTQLRPIQIGKGGYGPTPTSQVAYSANLPATSANATPIVSDVPVIDALGQKHTLQLAWTQTAGTANAWQVAIQQPGVSTPLGTAAIGFGTTANPGAPEGAVGSVNAVSGAVTGSTFAAGSPAQLQVTVDFGSGPQPITLDLGTYGQANGLTQYAGKEFNLHSLTSDGVEPGSFSSVNNRPNGDVVVNFDNGQSRVVARVPLTTFADPDALQREDGQAFTATRDSGAPQTLSAGKNGAGTLVTSAVEGSNVDIAKEFTKLIVAQRAYSANTKLVTTADELLQQTLDMKR